MLGRAEMLRWIGVLLMAGTLSGCFFPTIVEIHPGVQFTVRNELGEPVPNAHISVAVWRPAIPKPEVTTSTLITDKDGRSRLGSLDEWTVVTIGDRFADFIMTWCVRKERFQTTVGGFKWHDRQYPSRRADWTAALELRTNERSEECPQLDLSRAESIAQDRLLQRRWRAGVANQ
jgi:hypothetical protein